MEITGGLKGQLRSVIQWKQPGSDDLFLRWSEDGNEIKNASTLIVGPGQGCLFVYQGRIGAVHQTEGMVELQTANLPFWTTVTQAMQAFRSEHHVGIYFFTRRKIVDQKWGTVSPVKYEEPTYGFAAAVRAHGNFSVVLDDPEVFFGSLAAGLPSYGISDLQPVLAERIVQTVSEYLGKARPPYLEIDVRREVMASGILAKLDPEFRKLGLRVLDFRIGGMEFDDETENRIRQIRDRIAAVQEAKALGMNHVEMQKLDAGRDEAGNESGAAGDGVGIGAGIALGSTMANDMGASTSGAPAAGAEERLEALRDLLDKKLIGEEDFRRKRQEILDAQLDLLVRNWQKFTSRGHR